MMFLVLQELFVEVGAGGGTSFTDTRIHPHISAQATVYPLKNFGAFYRFSLSNPNFLIKPPFSIDKAERLHVLGSSIRFANGNIQPWIEPGVAWYRERVRVSLFNDIIFEEIQGRTAVSLSGGVNIQMPWRKLRRLYFVPAGRIVGGRRPFWEADAGFAWRFGGPKNTR